MESFINDLENVGMTLGNPFELPICAIKRHSTPSSPPPKKKIAILEDISEISPNMQLDDRVTLNDDKTLEMTVAEVEKPNWLLNFSIDADVHLKFDLFESRIDEAEGFLTNRGTLLRQHFLHDTFKIIFKYNY